MRRRNVTSLNGCNSFTVSVTLSSTRYAAKIVSRVSLASMSVMLSTWWRQACVSLFRNVPIDTAAPNAITAPRNAPNARTNTLIRPVF